MVVEGFRGNRTSVFAKFPRERSGSFAEMRLGGFMKDENCK